MIDFVQWHTNYFAGDGSGSLVSRRSFKVSLMRCTALKLVGESVKTASLKGDERFGGVEGRLCGSGDSDDVTRWRTFVGKKG